VAIILIQISILFHVNVINERVLLKIWYQESVKVVNQI